MQSVSRDLIAMKMKRPYFSRAARFVGLLALLATPMVAAGRGQRTKVGNWGRLTFKNETRVGNLTLPPGRYLFEHINKGGYHYARFSRITWDHITRYRVAGVVKCQVERLPAKAKRTNVQMIRDDGFDRVTRIEIRGENVAHLFAGPNMKQ